MTAARTERLACAYFFVVPSLAYGILTSRLPALKKLVGASDGDIGLLLLLLGLSTLAGLVGASFAITRFGDRNVTAASSLFLAVTMILAGLAFSFTQLTICCLLAGFGVGLCDVGMNAQGIAIERRRNLFCMSFLHAVSGLGGVLGSLSGSLFATCSLSPFLNFLIILGGYMCFWPLAMAKSQNSISGTESGLQKRWWLAIPAFVLFCGITGLICHVAEGSTAEWGSILLHSVKGAPEREAALVFACFTGSLVICRFYADRLRVICGDFTLSFAGSILATLGMILVLLSPWPALCLAGYAGMGFGLAPLVPILFSRAGADSRLTPGQASSVISVLSYAGMLLLPPLLGFMAQKEGLQNALWVVVGCCALLVIASFGLRQKKS